MISLIPSVGGGGNIMHSGSPTNVGYALCHIIVLKAVYRYRYENDTLYIGPIAIHWSAVFPIYR